MDKSTDNRPRRHSGFFWPILLIIVGVIFLLNNTGQMSGDLWANLLRFWPVLFILMALDGILRREGVVGSTLVIGLGTAFLLSNLGYLALNVWAVLARLWPLFLLAFGFDILIGRRSWLASLAGAAAILAILVGALLVTGVQVERGHMATAQVRQALESGVKSAKIDLEPAMGSLRLEKLAEPVALVMGTIPDSSAIRVTENYVLENGQANYTLRSPDSTFVVTTDTQVYNWDLGLATDIPLDLYVSLGAGQADLDLSGLTLSALKLDLAVGQAVVVLPATSSFSGTIDNAIGQVEIIIPSGVEVVIKVDNALSVVQTGSGIVKDGDTYSAGGGGAKYRITLHISQAIGNINLRRQ
jgi:hypothetical protein